LIAIKGLNSILGEKDVAVYVCSKHQRLREKFPPTTERGSRPTHHSHAGWQLGVVRAKAKFKYPQRAATKLSKEFGVDRCVIVPETPLVASVLGHEAAHCGGREGIDSANPISEIGRLAINH
jgi:hypothetical protein